MSDTVKIVFTGIMGAGKTEAIRVISDIDVVSTDVEATDEVRERKNSTTVAMDYGEVILDQHTTLALYGTPGQERFRYMWEILAQGALGIVIMLDNSREDPLADLAMYLDNFSAYFDQCSVVIAITHTDIKPTPDIEMYRKFIRERQYGFPIYRIDAREKAQVLLLIESMLAMIEVAQGDWHVEA